MAPGRFEILALCGAFALVSGEGGWQTNLKAVPSDGIGGNAVLKVSWNAPSYCWLGEYTYEVTLTGDHVPSKSAKTAKTEVTFKDAEYWTKYTVACKTSCTISHKIKIDINTGPGAPHAVAGIDVRASNETAHVTVTEASLMPRAVDQYRLTYCNDAGLCDSTIISRNGLRGIVETELQGLEPGTKYNLTVVPEIDTEEGHVYRGDARTTKFTTHEDSFGAPRNFRSVPLNKTHILLGWDRPEDVHKDTELFYTVTYCHSETCEVLQYVEEPRFLAGPVGSKNNATISACEAMTDGHCGSATLNSNFEPPKKDYAAVSNISATLGEVSSDSVLCNVTWTIDDKPVRADNFTVKACSKNTCSTGSSNTTSAEVQLRHFEVYTDFSVTANYYPGLDVLVQRVNEISSEVETPGTAPGHVRNFTVKVTSNGAVISWVIPENIPEDVTNRTYIIKDMAGALDIPPVTTEELTLSNLTVYHQYNISVQMEVGHQNQSFRGEPTFRDFLTDVGTPGQVRDIEAVQDPDTNVYRVHWKPPASNETNGPINYYIVKAYNSQNAELSTMNIYGATNVTVKINNPVDYATYTFGITAVNLDNHQQPVKGEELQYTVWFHGIGQTNLKAVPSDGIGGNAVLKVSWDAPSPCWFKNYTYEVTLTGDHVPSKSATTSKTEITFKDAEYWTNYTVACKTSCASSHTITIDIYTGPGEPHAVAGIDVQASTETAHVIVTEASLMPRPVDKYRLAYCNVAGLCNFTIISRNGSRGIVETELQGLEPATKYNLTVVPEIDTEEGHVYRGDARTTKFTTHEDRQTNLKAVPSDGIGGNSVLKVSWDAPSPCWFGEYTYEVTLTGDHVPSKSATTSKTEITFEDAEFWTNYTVACKTSCVFSNTIAIEIYTGPGEPHAVAGIDVRASNETAHVTVTEASLMPRAVDQYRLTYCNDAGLCDSTIISRNGPGGIVETELQGLEPATRYNLIVVPEIDFKEDLVYRGDARTTKFTTHEDTFGAPRNFQAVPLNTTHILLGWDRPEDVHKDTELLYTVMYCHSETCEMLQSVKKPRFLAGPVGGTNNATIRACEAMADGRCGSAALNSNFKPPKKGQTNLKAVPSDGIGGNAVLKVSWDAPSPCWFKDYTYEVTLTGDHVPSKSATTSKTEITFKDAEYWTNYTVAFKTSCFFSNTIEIEIYTGPGEPHAVAGIDVRPSNETAHVTVTEASLMPRPVDQYRLTYCNDAGLCDSTIMSRNGPGGIVETELQGLESGTKYNLIVVPEIDFKEDKVYRGDARTTNFKTHEHSFGAPRNFRSVPLNKTHILLGWDRPEDVHKETELFYTVTYCHSETCEVLQSVEEPRFLAGPVGRTNNATIRACEAMADGRCGSATLNSNFKTPKKLFV